MTEREPNPKAEKIEQAIIGTCPSLLRAIEATRRVGPRDVPVIVLGESGTGKERIARLVHERSGREGRFLAINCAAFPESMLEAELFGHEKGAFTGATALKRGLFESADGGTLFLDEVGELPLALQAKLLRVLQEGRIRRVGATREVPVDVRIVSATHQDLFEKVERREFRRDLVFRLAGYRIELPPLRDRGRDVVRIARHLLRTDPALAAEKAWRLGRDAEEVLLRHDWSGNVRELRNVLIQVVVDARGHRLTARHVGDALGRRGAASSPSDTVTDGAILDMIRLGGEATGKEIRDELRLSKSAAQRRLRRLRNGGEVELIGVGAGSRYRVRADSPAAALDDRERLALDLAAGPPGVTRQSLSTAAAVSDRTASRLLKRLVVQGRLVAERDGRDVRYTTPPEEGSAPEQVRRQQPPLLPLVRLRRQRPQQPLRDAGRQLVHRDVEDRHDRAVEPGQPHELAHPVARQANLLAQISVAARLSSVEHRR